MFNNCFNRPQEFVNDPPLPLYVYSVGEKLLNVGEIAEMGSLKNTFSELIWGVDGVGELTLFGQKIRIEPNDVFYYLPGETHIHRALSDRWITRWITFDGPLAEAILLSCRYSRLIKGAGHVPDRCFEKLSASVTDSDHCTVREISGILFQILANLISGDTGPKHASTVVKACMEYIIGNIHDPNLTLEKLSRKFSVSIVTLSRLFKEKIGVPPGEFIRDRRLQAAQILLKNTNLPISEIAERCGFSDTTAFARFARRNLGTTPLLYRKQ